MLKLRSLVATLTLFAYAVLLPAEALGARETYRDILRDHQNWIEMVIRGQQHTGPKAVVEFSDERLTVEEANELSKALTLLDLKRLKLDQVKNYLDITYNSDTNQIEIENLDQGKFKINGKIFNINDSQSLASVAEAIKPLLNFDTKNASIFDKIWNSVLPSAYAVNEKAIAIGAFALVTAAIIYAIYKSNKDKKKKEKQKEDAKKKAKEKEKQKEENLKANFRDNLWHYRTGCDMAAHKGAVPHYVFADDACPQKNDKAARSECLRTKGDECRATYGEKPASSNKSSH